VFRPSGLQRLRAPNGGPKSAQAHQGVKHVAYQPQPFRKLATCRGLTGLSRGTWVKRVPPKERNVRALRLQF